MNFHNIYMNAHIPLHTHVYLDMRIYIRTFYQLYILSLCISEWISNEAWRRGMYSNVDF